MRFQHPGCDVHYELEGPADGLPVLMIHGFGCQLEIMRGCMEPAVAAAKANERLLRCTSTFPGHGRSAKADLTLASSDALAACLLALMDHVAPGRPFAVAGQSFGGYLALGLATQRPERVLGLGLVCPLTLPDLGARQVEKLELIRHDNAFLSTLSDAERESFLQLAVRADRQTWERFATEEAPGFSAANPAFMDAVDEHLPLSPDVDEALAARPFAGARPHPLRPPGRYGRLQGPAEAHPAPPPLHLRRPRHLRPQPPVRAPRALHLTDRRLDNPPAKLTRF